MISTVNELKDLIIWCTEKKVKSLKIGEMSFELSDLALIQDLTSIEDSVLNEDKKTITQKELLDALPEDASDDEEMLMWSTR